MKRGPYMLCRFCIILCLSVLLPYAAAADGASGQQPVQLLMPKEIFVGDLAEIQYAFSAPAGFSDAVQSGRPLELRYEGTMLARQEDSYTVRSMTLEQSGNRWTLHLQFIPWRTGTVELPAFNLADLLPLDAHDARTGLAPVMISLQPVTVSSLSEKTGIKTMRPAMPPVLVPGTIYAVYACVFFAVVLLAAFVQLLFRYRALRLRLQSFLRQRALRRNAKRTLRALQRLRKKAQEMDVCAFAGSVQEIMRRYLTCRFSYAFDTVVSSGVSLMLDQLAGGTLSGRQLETADALESLFRRLDYVRFSHELQGIDSGECCRLADDACACVSGFEEAV